MRKLIVPAIAAGLGLAAAAAALAQPPGAKMANGAWADSSGKALYTFDKDTTPGKSACNGPCANAWPPVTADASAKAAGDWTVITRDDGSKQWAYKGKPVYTFARDKAGAAGTGESVPNWKLAK